MVAFSMKEGYFVVYYFHFLKRGRELLKNDSGFLSGSMVIYLSEKNSLV